jgi:membrane-associated phospholipid phosphatase
MLDATRPLPRPETPGPRPAPRPGPRTAPRVVAAVIAVLAALGVHLTWQLFVATARGQRVDDLAFDGAEHGQGTLWVLAEPLLDVVSNTFVLAGIGVAVLLALVRRRWVLAVQVAALIVGANVTTQVLKHWVYDRPELLDGWVGPNALPSGHTTVAASIAAGLLLAAPRGWRPLVAVAGSAWAAATGLSTLVGQWHRPSEVVAALLVVLAWGAAVCALTPASSLDRPRSPGDRMATPGSKVVAGLLLLGGAAAAAVAAVAVGDLATGSGRLPLDGDVTAYAGGVCGVVAVTALVFALLLLLRQASARPAR